ncbi:MAG: hypothetical protein EXS37_03480 [Opitutus sp.]|nr:hypothetical protein [Opitutus sp.]
MKTTLLLLLAFIFAPGTFIHGQGTTVAPVILRQPAAATEVGGGNVAFIVAASGTLPLSYQWRKDGAPLAGATTDVLFLPTLQPAHAGAYACIVTNAAGSSATANATLSVLARNPSPDPVDPTFAPDTLLNSAPVVAALQADGKILLGGAFSFVNQGRSHSGLVRLRCLIPLSAKFSTASPTSSRSGSPVRRLFRFPQDTPTIHPLAARRLRSTRPARKARASPTRLARVPRCRFKFTASRRSPSSPPSRVRCNPIRDGYLASALR